MKQTCKLVVSRAVKVVELFVAHCRLNRQAISDVSLNIHVGGCVVLLCQSVIGKAAPNLPPETDENGSFL